MLENGNKFFLALVARRQVLNHASLHLDDSQLATHVLSPRYQIGTGKTESEDSRFVCPIILDLLVAIDRERFGWHRIRRASFENESVFRELVTLDQ